MAFRAASFRGRATVLVLGGLAAGAGCGKSTSSAPNVRFTGEAGDSAAGDRGTSLLDGGAPGGAGAASSGAGVASSGGAPGGAGPASDGSGANAGESAAGEAGAPAVALSSLTLRALTISQTHELPLLEAGAAVPSDDRPAPLVAGKRALVRAFIDLAPSFVARPLLGVLDLKTPQVTRTLLSRLTPSQSSLQDDLKTTFVFNVDARDLSTATSYRVRVLEEDTTPIAHFPDSGYVDLEAKTMQPFELVVVPFVSNGFAPQVGDAEISALKRRLVALYPSTDVEVTRAAPVTLGYVVNGAGDGWDDALDEIYQERAAAQPARNVFYYGMLAPDDSYDSYCATDCTLGLSNIADPDDVDSRGSIGITVFQDGSGVEDAWDTVAHELGHALGRDHAPCGLKDADPDYPYPGGGMGGIYGYDFDLTKLIRPKLYRDVMSYCTPVWISDYTYRGIFERLDYIEHEAFRTLSLSRNEPFRLARIRRSGESLWLGERERHGSATPKAVALLDSAGRRLGSVAAQVTRLDHAPGGYVWLPLRELEQSGAASVDLRPLGGSVLSL